MAVNISLLVHINIIGFSLGNIVTREPGLVNHPIFVFLAMIDIGRFPATHFVMVITGIDPVAVVDIAVDIDIAVNIGVMVNIHIPVVVKVPRMPSIISGRPVPAPAIPSVVPGHAHSIKTRAPGVSNPPAHHRNIMGIKTPGAGPRVIMRTVPSRIIIAGAVHHGAVIGIPSQITGGVTHIDHLRGDIININIFNIVNRILRRNGLKIVRDGFRDHPGAVGRGRHEPDRIGAGVVSAVEQDHRGGGVDRIVHIGSPDVI